MFYIEWVSYENFLGTESEKQHFFNSSGITGIFGPCGSGKSETIEAIIFAWYGVILKDDYTKADLVNVTAGKNCCVKSKANFNGDEIEISRYIKHETHKDNSYIKINGSDETEKIFKSNKDITTFISNLICPLDIFIKTCIFPQNSKDTFVYLKNSERFNFFTKVAGLEKYDLYKVATKKAMDEVEFSITKVESEIKALLEEKNNIISIKERAIKKYEENKEVIKSKIKDIENNISVIYETLKSNGNFESFDSVEKELKRSSDMVSNMKTLLETSKSQYDSNISRLNSKKENEIKKSENEILKIKNIILDETNKHIEEINKKLSSKVEEINAREKELFSKTTELVEKLTKENTTKIKELSRSLEDDLYVKKEKINERAISISHIKKSLEDEIENLENTHKRVVDATSKNPEIKCSVCKRPMDESCLSALDEEKKKKENLLKEQILGFSEVKKLKDENERNISMVKEKISNLERGLEESKKHQYSQMTGSIESLKKEKESIINSIENMKKSAQNQFESKYEDQIKQLNEKI